MKSEKKHLHIVSVLTEFIATLRNVILPAGLGFIAGLRHFSDYLGYILLIPLVLAVFDFLKWLRLTYEITDEHFHLQSGVLVRNDRYIRINRIQSVQIRTNILLRLFGLVQLKLDTADPASRGDITLSVLTKKEAGRIQRAIGHGKEQLPAEDSLEAVPAEQPAAPIKRFVLSGKDLWMAALTSSNIGIIGVLLALFSQVDDVIPDSFWGSSVDYFSHLPITLLVFLVAALVLLLWLISLFVTMLRWGGFRLTVTGGQWFIHKGILQTKDETYKTNRVQAIRIRQQLLQQLFGYCTVYAELSGSVDGENRDEGSVLVYPFVCIKQLPDFLEEIIPRFAGQMDVRRIPLRGILYGTARPLLFLTVAAGILTWFFSWGKWLWLILPPIAGWIYSCYYSRGCRLRNNRFVLTGRFLSKSTVITLTRHLQTFSRKRSPLQRQIGLGNFRVMIRSSAPRAYRVNQMASEDTESLMNRLRNHSVND
ncbi:PH domain-containing protein [Sporolactobacillus sp. Y61]|uniref:PH domain-containing protein n=1 Tax=Sporolactobacillus sp. Y61 TaxID=3160863 RepID=A0AAU8IHR9_9BACL